MVEYKNSVYDEDAEPPLVPATPLEPAESTFSSSPTYEAVTGVAAAGNTSRATNRSDAQTLSSIPSSSPSSTSQTTTRDNNDGDSTGTPSQTNDKMVASGTGGAVLGFFLGGPLISALLGFTAAYASQKRDAVGDAARALGDVAISTKKKAIELDEKHDIVNRSSQAATGAWEKAKEYDRRHNVLDKVKDTVISGWGSFTRFVQEHRLLERGVEKAGKGYEYVAEKVGSKNQQTTST